MELFFKVQSVKLFHLYTPVPNSATIGTPSLYMPSLYSSSLYSFPVLFKMENTPNWEADVNSI